MQDIVQKVDRAKEIVRAGRTPQGSAADGAELIDMAIESIGELLANSRRIAAALETLAECVDDNCQPAFVVKAMIEPGAPQEEGE